MNMTHYMALLADNQPSNLLIYLAIPVVLAETLAITELVLLLTRQTQGWVAQLNRFAGLTVGLYFVGIIIDLTVNAVIPITRAGEWRTVIDVIAVLSYLIGGLPMVFIALQELRWVQRHASAYQRQKTHALCVALFLVFAHIAMIAGMLDPGLLADGQATMPMGHGH